MFTGCVGYVICHNYPNNMLWICCSFHFCIQFDNKQCRYYNYVPSLTCIFGGIGDHIVLLSCILLLAALVHWLVVDFSLLLATEYHLGLLKAKLAKYRAQLLEPSGKAGAKVCGILLLCTYTSILVQKVISYIINLLHW